MVVSYYDKPRVRQGRPNEYNIYVEPVYRETYLRGCSDIYAYYIAGDTLINKMVKFCINRCEQLFITMRVTDIPLNDIVVGDLIASDIMVTSLVVRLKVHWLPYQIISRDSLPLLLGCRWKMPLLGDLIRGD